ncbi:MAG TPA: alpha/beta hydrolase [Lachnospiraceae bacterium]|nr:alpha/beta hydrolase [Lachnospiraceae bacterium]
MKGNSVYKSKESKKRMTEYYDKQLSDLHIIYEDVYVDTRFGKTHLIKTGNPNGSPLMIFHGGNQTGPFSLKAVLPLTDQFLIYAPDTIGHPGKSEPRVLNPKTMEYGEWASDVISGLGYDRMFCMGESFGGGILAKLMCTAPSRIRAAVLIVPSGIKSASTASHILKMGIPMIAYILTQKEKWLIRAIEPLAAGKKVDESTLEMTRLSFQNVSIKAGMPSDISAGMLTGYHAPTCVIAGEKDCMFPGNGIIERAKQLFTNVETHLLKESGHLFYLSEERTSLIIDTIRKFLCKNSEAH